MSTQMSLEAVPWRVLGDVTPEELTKARLELHACAQLLGSFGQALVEPRPDYSHRSMTWSATETVFLSEPTRDTPETRLGLGPRSLTVSIRVGGALAAERSFVGGTLEDAYRWLEAELGSNPTGPKSVELGRPEHVVAPALANGEPFSTGQDSQLLELEAWFGNAATILETVRAAHAEATPVRCWPHHCEIATLLALDPELGAEDGRSVGVGFSPGDEGYPLPYLYVTPYPYPDGAHLPELPAGAHWHREEWIGAVLTGDALVSAGGAEDQEVACRSFVERAIGASKALLAG